MPIIVGRGNVSRAGNAGESEVCMIEGIERVRAEDQLGAFSDREVFPNAEVEVCEVRSAKIITATHFEASREAECRDSGIRIRKQLHLAGCLVKVRVGTERRVIPV